MRKTLLFIFIFLFSSLLGAQQNVSAPQKHALVIGNGAYTGITPLKNPVNDASEMETSLRALGFTVEKVLNGNLDQMETAIQNFRRRLGASRNSYGFFFYAGHGVQANGANYLIPVDAGNIQSENHLRQRAVSVQTMLDNLNDAGNELNIIVLDACRDNPFGWARSGSRGLALVNAPMGSIVVYATSANSTADDGTGRNGLFTGELLKNLGTPGLNVQEVFNRTGRDVLQASGGSQHPEISLKYFDEAYLGARPAAATPQPAPAPAVVQPQPQPAPQPTVQPSAPAYKIGDRGPGGGIIFFAENGVYMECSMDIGSFKQNDAMNAASNYRGGGFTDWRLPSQGELELMYRNLKQKGLGGFGNSVYRSSNVMIGFNFKNGKLWGTNKSALLSVRAVRAF